MKNKSVSKLSNEQLTPSVLSSKARYIFWAVVYNSLHLSLWAYLFTSSPPKGSTLYIGLAYAIALGPFVYFSDLYLRIIWLPYRREVSRRGGVPKESARHHAYKVKMVLTRGIGLVSGAFAVSVLLVFFRWDEFSDNIAWPIMVIGSLFGVPIVSFGFFHSFFVWEGAEKS